MANTDAQGWVGLVIVAPGAGTSILECSKQAKHAIRQPESCGDTGSASVAWPDLGGYLDSVKGR